MKDISEATQFPSSIEVTDLKMRGLLVLLALNFAAFAGAIDQPIVVPSLQNPHLANFLFADGLQIYSQHCVGTIINDYTILTTASCSESYQPHQVRVRVGSPFASSLGVVFRVASLVAYPDRGSPLLVYRENDIGIVRVSSAIEFWSNVQPATFGIYDVPVGDQVETYAYAYMQNFLYEPLRKEGSRVISPLECNRRYFVPNADNGKIICSVVRIEDSEAHYPIVPNYGSPLYHNGVVVGVASYLQVPGFPVAHATVGSYIDWIRANA